MDSKDFKFGPHYWAMHGLLSPPPKTPGLINTHKNYIANLSRIHNMQYMLPGIIAPIIIIEKTGTHALLELESKEPAADQQRRDQYALEKISEAVAAFDSDAVAMSQGSPPTRRWLELQGRTFHMLKIVSTDFSSIEQSLESWLASIIVECWGTFEVMAGDLWEAALNTHPNILCEMRGKKKEEMEGKTFPLKLMQKYDYDLKHKMGSIWRTDLSLASLASIQSAYKAAFCIDNKSILGAIDSTEILRISAMRNIIVHNSSKFDQQYLNLVSKDLKTPKGAVGESLPPFLDYEFIEEMLLPFVERSVELINAVDDWIQKN
ncbi:hypothetical protein [Methylobacterium sp. E-045]|uniref:hypothetical protein n=1 Tax=Methylobacterium sp. E-045 TaxID=2836575 RepID=UPI001FB94452|nr:hypothetical protein [Methylobacterium sp. E-045]MCJ2129215.1 hypothetical protein [Methylobacterium sp. E-045]